MPKYQWVARFQYPGLKPCYFGTIIAETEMQAERIAHEAWAQTLPFPPPNTFIMERGFLALHLEDEDA